ncbi:MAG: hypothetical protein AMXMBFR4_19940 [Candidatus Hydrogenedentota bacterium]
MNPPIDTINAGASRRLLEVYLKFAFWYLLLVVVLNSVGFEAIYLHPTPFYALWMPVAPSVFAPAAVLALMTAALCAISGFVNIRTISGLLAIVLAALLFDCLRLNLTVDECLVRGWSATRSSLPAVAMFLVFATSAVIWMRRTNWLDAQPATGTIRPILIGLILFSFLYSGAVAVVRDGVDGITAAYSRTGYEYVDDIGRGMSIRGLFRDYVSMHPHLSMHAKVHPPGPIVILWVLSMIVLSREALPLSLATMAVGSLAILPLYAWVRDMLGARVALLCCALFPLVPSITLFTATSADITFMPIVILTLFLFWRALHRKSIAYAVGAGILYAVCSLTSFSLLTLGAFFAFAGLWRLTYPEYRVSVVKTAAVMFTAFLAVHAGVWLWSGFNVIECFRLSSAQFFEDQRNLDLISPRFPSWTFRLLNPLCWIFFAGIPVSILFFLRVLKPDPEAKPLFLVFVLTLIVLTPLYLARGEGERSAMYILPFVLVPAAHMLDQICRNARSVSPAIVTFAFLAYQGWIIEYYLFTYW